MSQEPLIRRSARMTFDFFEELTNGGERTGRIAVARAGKEPLRAGQSQWYRVTSTTPWYLSNSLDAKVRLEGVVIGRR